MKTPMQLLYEQLERTVIQQKGMMSYGEYESFKAGMEMSIAIIEQDGYFEKEKKEIMNAYNYGQQIPPFEYAEKYYNETFNTNQKNLPDSTNGYTYYPQERKIIFNTKEK